MIKPLSILLCLALSLSLCACGGKDVQPAAPTAYPDQTAEPLSSPVPDEAPMETPAASEAPAETEFPIAVPMGESYSLDLNGDDLPETICVSHQENVGNINTVTVTVNGIDCSAALYDNFWLDYPEDSCWFLTDVYSADTLLEISVEDWGPSDDPHTMFLRYDGSGLYPFGEVPGMIGYNGNTGDISFEADGFVHTTCFRLSVLQTWFAEADYEIGNMEWLTLVPRELYEANFPTPVTLKTDLLGYNGKDGDAFPIAAGVEMTVLATDDAEWLYCESEAEDWALWFHLNPERSFEIETPDGFAAAWDALDGLLFAD